MYCEKCGAKIPDDAKFCTKCGNPAVIIETGDSGTAETGTLGKGTEKKHKLAAIAAGIFFSALAVVAVAALFATGKLDAIVKPDKLTTAENTISPEGSADTAGEDTGLTDMETELTDMDTNDNGAEDKEEESTTDAKAQEAYDTNETFPEEQDFDNDSYGEIEQVDMAFLEYVTASSELSESSVVHSVNRIYDGSLDKAWVEGKKGQGKGENVSFVFDRELCFDGMKIYAGYQKSKDLYYKNSRPKKLKLVFSDGSVKNVKLKDKYGIQKIKFGMPIAASEVTVIIKSVYKGYKYSDTVISELSWF